MPLGLLAGIEIDTVQTILAPGAQQEVRARRGAERCRDRFAFPSVPLHVQQRPE
jgi:hypothetical protein